VGHIFVIGVDRKRKKYPLGRPEQKTENGGKGKGMFVGLNLLRRGIVSLHGDDPNGA